ncbi:YybH family protein [Flavobacterium sp.]
MKKIILLAMIITLFSCSDKTNVNDRKKAVAEVFEAEEDFKNLAGSKGIAEAFYAFADESAVIKRENDTLIKGKGNIKTYYSQPKFKKASVTWKPDYVDVSEDGSMASTYGNYIWTVTDSVGNKKEFKGIFHTVWKKQKDGSWKYIWD